MRMECVPQFCGKSLPAWGGWIEICRMGSGGNLSLRPSPHGEGGLKLEIIKRNGW